MGRFRALPYAKALHAVITDTDPTRAEQLMPELDRVVEALAAVPEFHRVLTTPMVTPAAKTAILDAVLGALAITEPTRRFLHVVQRHYRMEQMPQIAVAYRELVDRAAGRTRATVQVAGPIDEGQRQEILAALREVLSREVVADFEENSALLAGFRVQVGSRVFDGSLDGALDRLSRATAFD
jgi:F-type H+-transporting ATPase subunit delta